MLLEIKSLKKKFANNTVLKGINLSIKAGEVVVIIGPSGSGKTTLLRNINFLEQADSGTMVFKDKQLNLANLSNEEILWVRRHTAMVFQNYNLFKNKTAIENISEGLIFGQNRSKKDALQLAKKALDSVGLLDKQDFYPAQLSGGQQQRIGIVRATVLNPDIVLFDEPTSALDPELVGTVLYDMKQLADQGQTMIVVTHQMSFARNVASRVVFFADGEIIETGTPSEVFDHPKNKRTKQFLSAIAEDY
ncbi:amino acid ABC transporter ATP-binding protein [Loigolactobacillus backii]|uniref:Amino acid ABC transporter ATP-binding protein n=1 Tax=Loigolactobacillus backii TaxID=375175 RepID=A0A192H2P5_9LACO|nr:amino acid ABC transporter ATP-binding protein [Loigolactobacillus backii]ANK60337.1 amino acid ABC transporter ATP-binding protein [Loigolactobacillus backii]ANK62221.1 amino acid ABC transporter ATP-binding protein [Loigolactobacillus backii]ANK65218.1 amino acid ABC transporter ATP-binding protein [Loigolactobacillus backii]ANK67776.1 amino acid ABC transporter ATP-binding protein [Loigolactobacillus backii]ANK70764.1 amino acid ABC transporter ATP-binding protein [Loigolactobacillus bac